jgi:small subunit ribosomal protein S1
VAKKQSNTTPPATSMEELLSRSNVAIKGFTKGQKIDAKLIEIGRKYATFDVGGKSEGVLVDAYFAEAKPFLTTLKPGDVVQATVMDPETREGNVLLSLRHAASDLFWENLENAKNSGQPITVVGRSASPKGIAVDVDALITFIPISQIGKAAASNLEALVGNRFKVKVIEVDKSRRKVLLSEKAISEEKELGQIQTAIASLKENEVYKGVVKEVTNFGAFVEIVADDTTVEGLVHVSELSWHKVKDPHEILSEGDKIEVKILGLRDGKLALSLKQAVEDPWIKAAEKYSVDQRLKGKVVRHSDFGVFVELEPGIEGLIHMTKIPPATKLSVGQEVEVYIEEIDAPSRKISLGLVLTSKPVGYK